MGDGENVGYKRPPKGSRFRPGQSGNPSGRPKRHDFQTVLSAELAAATPGKAASKLEALVTTLVDASIGGNMRALSVLVPLLRNQPTQSASTPTQEDVRVLDDYVERRARSIARQSKKTEPGNEV